MWQAGQLLVGGFNGGVYSLESRPRSMLTQELTRGGTTFIINLNPFDETAYATLATISLVFGIVSLIFGCHKVIEIRNDISESSREAMVAVRALYCDIMDYLRYHVDTAAAAMAHHTNNADHEEAHDLLLCDLLRSSVEDLTYQPLTFKSACAAFGRPVADFSAVLLECRHLAEACELERGRRTEEALTSRTPTSRMTTSSGGTTTTGGTASSHPLRSPPATPGTGSSDGGGGGADVEEPPRNVPPSLDGRDRNDSPQRSSGGGVSHRVVPPPYRAKDFVRLILVHLLMKQHLEDISFESGLKSYLCCTAVARRKRLQTLQIWYDAHLSEMSRLYGPPTAASRAVPRNLTPACDADVLRVSPELWNATVEALNDVLAHSHHHHHPVAAATTAASSHQVAAAVATLPGGTRVNDGATLPATTVASAASKWKPLKAPDGDGEDLPPPTTAAFDGARFEKSNPSAALPVVTAGIAEAEGSSSTSSPIAALVTKLRELSPVFTPIVNSLQVVLVWVSSMSMPQDFVASINRLMEAVSADITRLADAIEILTPILYFLAAFAIVGAFAYFAIFDTDRFIAVAASYAHRRDALSAATKDVADEVNRRVAGVYFFVERPRESVPAPSHPEVVLLPPTSRAKLFAFMDEAEASAKDGDGAVAYACGSDVVDIPLRGCEDNPLQAVLDATPSTTSERVFKDSSKSGSNRFSWRYEADDGGGLTVAGAAPVVVSTVPVRCPQHSHRALFELTQTGLFPPGRHRRCCAVENGVRCPTRQGSMFVCHAAFDENAGDEQNAVHGAALHQDPRNISARDVIPICEFALCAAHFQPNVVDTIRSKLRGLWHRVDREGIQVLLGLAMVFLTNTIFTPFLRSAFLILRCHPNFRCAFNLCWEAPTTDFYLAAYCSIVTILVVGGMLPSLMFYVVWKRRRVLHNVFLDAAQYGDRYMEGAAASPHTEPPRSSLSASPPPPLRAAADDGHEGTFAPAVDDSSLPGSNVASVVVASSGSMTSSHSAASPREPPLPPAAPAIVFVAPLPRGQAPQPREPIAPPSILARRFWMRWLEMDNSLLSDLYRALEFRYMLFPPMLLLIRAVVVFMPVLFEPNSVDQFVAVLVIESLFALIMFTTSPFSSAYADFSFRISFGHEFFILGLQCVFLVESHIVDRDVVASFATPGVMTAVSGAYTAFAFLLFIHLTVAPIVQPIWKRRGQVALVKRLGLITTCTAPLYVAPVGPRRDGVVDRPGVDAQLTEGVPDFT